MIYDSKQKKFKTIDQFIDSVNKENFGSGTKQTDSEDLCRYCLLRYPDMILDILRSEFNEPSKYDLYIIKSIDPNSIVYKNSIVDYNKNILEIYNNRKV